MAKQKGRFLSEAIVLQAFPAKQLLLLQKKPEVSSRQFRRSN
jgi:hypothetical protein